MCNKTRDIKSIHDFKENELNNLISSCGIELSELVEYGNYTKKQKDLNLLKT